MPICNSRRGADSILPFTLSHSDLGTDWKNLISQEPVNLLKGIHRGWDSKVKAPATDLLKIPPLSICLLKNPRFAWENQGDALSISRKGAVWLQMPSLQVWDLSSHTSAAAPCHTGGGGHLWLLAAFAAWRQNFHLFKPCSFDFTFLPLIDLPPLTPDEQQEEEKQNSVTLLPDLRTPACKYTTYELCVKLDGRANPGLHLGDLNTASSRSTLLVSLVRVNSCPSQSCSYILRLGDSNTLAGPQTPDSCLLNSCVLIYRGVRNLKQRSAIFS